ncbi:MAG: DUF3225 domain-containing protein [Brasilonema angustatum HA4187-MV1]|nr:DUF3225 domain-containing protein [Brasilonema angustatum HA4187-MV1]
MITTYGHDFAIASTEFTRNTSPNNLGRQATDLSAHTARVEDCGSTCQHT